MNVTDSDKAFTGILIKPALTPVAAQKIQKHDTATISKKACNNPAVYF